MIDKDEIILECINIMNDTGESRADALRHALENHYEAESSALEMMTKYNVGYKEALEIAKDL